MAERCGTVWHPLMQWSGIVAGHTDPGWGETGWRYHEPRQGQLPTAELAAIARILADHTTTPDDCTAGLWEGYGWIHGGQAVSAFVAIPEGASRRKRAQLLREARSTVPPGLADEVRSGPLLVLPGRNYLLFTGSIHAFENPDAAPSWDGADTFWEQTPNQLWPADHAWFLASEIDFDSTVIGGTRALVEELVASPDLEVRRDPGRRLTGPRRGQDQPERRSLAGGEPQRCSSPLTMRHLEPAHR